jgi:hypothetical protein
VQRGKAWDLSKVEKLREEFKQAPFKNIQIADLQAFLQRKLAEMLAHANRLPAAAAESDRHLQLRCHRQRTITKS